MTKPLIANRETKNDEKAWSGRIKARDKGLCRFEARGRAGAKWRACMRQGTDAAHIYRRWQCGKAKFDDAVGLWACREHHEEYDAYEYDRVRVPLDRLRAAYDAIASVSKVMTMGERP